jgi:hypothetical protein
MQRLVVCVNLFKINIMSSQSGIPKFFKLAATEKAWYPTPSANLTGTLTSEGKTVRGTSTVFLSELSVGDYLLNPTTDDVQVILRVESDTLLMLAAAMTTTLSATTCKRIKSQQIKKATIVFAGTGPGVVRGASQATAIASTWPVTVPLPLESDGGLLPFLVTAPASTTAHISTVE